MSYILDALKRSEQERHQGELNHTTIDTIMMPSKQVRHQLWPYLLIVILLINLLVYLYFQFSDESVIADHGEVAVQIDIIASENVIQNQANKSTRPSSHDDQIPAKASDLPEHLNNGKPLPSHLFKTPNLTKRFDMGESSQAYKINSSSQTKKKIYNDEGYELIKPKASTNAISSKSLMPPQAVEKVLSNKENSQQTLNQAIADPVPVQHIEVEQVKLEDFEDIYHLNDLDLNFQKGIPDIRFNSHIYSLNPADRRVMINDLYLREGQSFSGITIDTIGEFYIVLSKGSQNFKIPVLRDWFSPET